MTELIQIHRQEHIATVTINRAEKLNAITQAMWRTFTHEIETLSQDDNLRCIIIKGAGGRAFSPGCDISEFNTLRANRAQAMIFGDTMHATFAALAKCPIPLVAQIQGVCVGGGLIIASLCDIRICGESSRFGVPIKNLGSVLAYEELTPLVERVGANLALEILLEGRILSAKEAKENQLVNRVVADDLVAEEAYATAIRIAEGAPLSARWHKQFIRQITQKETLSETDYARCYDCFETADYQTGFQAFLNKEKPHFKGK